MLIIIKQLNNPRSVIQGLHFIPLHLYDIVLLSTQGHSSPCLKKPALSKQVHFVFAPPNDECFIYGESYLGS